MSTTTLIIIGMIELFIIAMAWISAWTRATEGKLRTNIFIALLNSEADLDFVRELADEMDNVKS